MPGVFVTATGTDVGKTYVTCGLIRAARRASRPVDALKPVLSGYAPAAAVASDAGRLLDALGRPITEATIARLSPWRLAAPLSPDMAAAAEGREIAFGEVCDACRRAVRPDATTFIEGVGGVMVPLDRSHTVLDLMARLAGPIVLVSGTALGAISHCLTAVAAMGARGLAPAMIVLDESDGSSVPVEATRATLTTFLDDIPLHVVPRGAQDAVFDALWRDLDARLRA